MTFPHQGARDLHHCKWTHGAERKQPEDACFIQTGLSRAQVAHRTSGQPTSPGLRDVLEFAQGKSPIWPPHSPPRPHRVASTVPPKGCCPHWLSLSKAFGGFSFPWEESQSDLSCILSSLLFEPLSNPPWTFISLLSFQNILLWANRDTWPSWRSPHASLFFSILPWIYGSSHSFETLSKFLSFEVWDLWASFSPVGRGILMRIKCT